MLLEVSFAAGRFASAADDFAFCVEQDPTNAAYQAEFHHTEGFVQQEHSEGSFSEHSVPEPPSPVTESGRACSYFLS